MDGGRTLSGCLGGALHMCAHACTCMHMHVHVSDDVIMGIPWGNPFHGSSHLHEIIMFIHVCTCMHVHACVCMCAPA